MNILKWLTNEKYRFFYAKIGAVQKSIWDLDFKIEKSRQVREGVRQDRDRAIESLNMINTRLKAEDISPEEKEKLEQDLAIYTDNVSRYERQMKMIDGQIQGVPAQGENPGEQGILETIASYAELKAMYKHYLKNL